MHKNTQVVTGLQKSYKSVHKLSASCVRTASWNLLQLQVWYKLLTTCYKVDGIIRLVSRLLQHILYSLDKTRMLQD